MRYPKNYEDANDEFSGSEGPATPHGAINTNRRLPGWQGQELELGHQQEVLRSGRKERVVTAVDIRQFQNHVVGQGYQAKHVVRQPSANLASFQAQITDMSGGAVFHSETEKAKKADSGYRDYIKNDGLREFRKEIESILASP